MLDPLRRRLRERAGRATTTLSVVVPVHDVADYLVECLDSVLAQELPRGTRLEVVCVDDGSTDDSPAVLADVARRDPRVVVLRQDNAGLGAARNAGVLRAGGDLLTFCDSDDVVPAGAYDVLVRTLLRTGSQVAVGALQRFEGDRTSMGPLMRENHRTARDGVTVGEVPLLLADVFAVNKVYRRDFWDAADARFPVGTRYEDQPALTRLLLSAGSIDVLPDVVYRWRSRADGSSITQGRARIEDLRDRLTTKRDSTRSVLDAADPGLLPVWFGRVLPVDMWEYFRAGATADEDYWRLLVSGVRELWPPGTRGFEDTEVPVQQRLMGVLVAQDRREDLVRLLRAIEERGVRPVSAGSRVVDLPFAREPGVPARAWTLSDREVAARS